MFKKLKQTAKQSIIYSLGNISAKLIGFILLPLYTEFLMTEEYGIFAILEVTNTIMVAVFGFKLSTAMMRWCAVESSKDRIKALVFSTYLATLIAVIAFNLASQPFAKQFSMLFFNETTFESYFYILFTSISFEILGIYVFDLIRMKEKPLFFVALSILRFTAVLIANIYFIRYQGIGVKGILWAMLIGNALVVLITLPLLLRNMKPIIVRSEMKAMFNYGFPLVFSTISMTLLNLGDRFIMKYLLNYSEVGIYSLGYKIASFTNVFIIQSFQTGFLPIAYKNFSKPDAQRFFSKTLTYYTYILVFLSLIVSLYSEELILILSKNADYNIAYTIVPFLSLALIFRGIQYVYSLGLHFTKKTKYNAYIVMGTAIVHFGLNFALIPFMGIYGAALATIISWGIMSTIFYRISYKYYKVKYEIGKMFLLITVGVVLYAISLFLIDLDFYLKIGIKLFIILTFPFILRLFNFYEPVELLRIKGFWQKWRNPLDWKKNMNYAIKAQKKK